MARSPRRWPRNPPRAPSWSPRGDPVEVVIGVGDAELHYLARVVDGEVQVILPPMPIRHYHFPGHPPTDVVEDVSARIRPA